MTSSKPDDKRARMLAFESLLDGSRDALEQHVEMNTLRRLCARSIPDQPSHLRPLSYSLLLGTLPSDKKLWKQTTRRQCDNYYTLVRTFMDELEAAPEPSDPLSANDLLLRRISKDVDRLDMPVLRGRTSPPRSSPLAPMPSGDGVNGDSGASSSSSADEGLENEVRTTPTKSRTRSRSTLPKLNSRRALFDRLELIAARRASQGPSNQSPTETVTSPELLSPDSSRPGLARNSSTMSDMTPSLSLTIPCDSASQPASPVTLLSPQVVTAYPLSPDPRLPSRGSLSDPDTHAEAIARLLYVFCRANAQWAYAPTLVDVVVPLYLVYCEAKVTRTLRTGRWRRAEEETYWAFTALMGELGDLVAGVPGDDVISTALHRVSARVRWADGPLWNVLKSRNLDPGLPLYTFQWLTSLLSNNRANLLPLWDFLFAQPPTTPNMNPKLDLLIDLCVALIVMVKQRIMFPPKKVAPPTSKRDMWAGSDHMDLPEEPEDPDAAFVRCLQLFRDYPINEVGGIWMLLNTAFELNQARRASQAEGEDPDSPNWMVTKDAEANRQPWALSKVRQASHSTGMLWSSYSQSDTVASITKASTNLTASALAKWQTAPTPGWKGLGAAAGRWLSKKPANGDDEGSVSGDEYEYSSPRPSTPGQGASPINQRERFTPSPTKHTSLPIGSRKRSDSVVSASALSVSSLQERLTGLATGLSVREPVPPPRVTAGPRPLLLSTSARRASNGHDKSPGSRRISGGSSPSGLTGGLASPPHHDPGRPGLYRIGSRRSPRRSGADSAAVQKDSRASLGSDDHSTPYGSDTSVGLGAMTSALAMSLERSPRPPSVPEHPLPVPHIEPLEAPEPISIPTPQISHLTPEDYEHVYEPAEDSFILLDALEADALVLRDTKPALCVEIGSGSGIASTFVGSLLGAGEACLMSTDINSFATAATLRTGDANDVALNPVLAYLLDPVQSRMAGKIDLLMFNPPYVVTDDDELIATQSGRDIGGAWAGGSLGMMITNILLEILPALLAPGGRFYLVAIHQNKPDEIIARMRAAGLECKTVMKRRAGRELLSVIRMIQPAAPRTVPPAVGITPVTSSRLVSPVGSALSRNPKAATTITPTVPIAAPFLPPIIHEPAEPIAVTVNYVKTTSQEHLPMIPGLETGEEEDYKILLDAYGAFVD